LPPQDGFPATLFLIPCFSRTAIDAALIPKGAPAFFASAEGWALDQGNPDMAANITNRDFHGFPAHCCQLYKMTIAQKEVEAFQ